jgi:hypothetical protein
LHFGGFFDTFKDPDIPGAPAQIPDQSLLDFFFTRVRATIQKSPCRHQNPGGAETTLHAALLQHGFLDRVETLIVCKALDGQDVRSVTLDSQDHATVNRLSIHQDCAGAAFSGGATIFRSRQRQAFAQHAQEGHIGWHNELFKSAIDGDIYFMNSHINLQEILPKIC